MFALIDGSASARASVLGSLRVLGKRRGGVAACRPMTVPPPLTGDPWRPFDGGETGPPENLPEERARIVGPGIHRVASRSATPLSHQVTAEQVSVGDEGQ